MNANELMLGNYVEFNETIYKVLAIKSGFTQVAYKSARGNFIVSWIDNDSLKPIPLTEKWLLDFFFNKDYKIGYVGKDFGNTDFVLTVPLTLGEWQKGYVFEFLSGGWSKFVEFNYVHELQNFYFTMTKSFLQLVEPK